MTNPASLANSQVSQPDPELHETTINEDATEPGQEIRCLAPWLGVGLATDPMAWQPVTTSAGEFWPKKGNRALVTAQPDGPPLIAWWEPAEGAEPDRVITGGAGGFYKHEQSLTTQVWVIPHGLGRTPSVICFDTEGQEIKGQVVPISENEIEIHFNLEISGKAYLN